MEIDNSFYRLDDVNKLKDILNSNSIYLDLELIIKTACRNGSLKILKYMCEYIDIYSKNNNKIINIFSDNGFIFNMLCIIGKTDILECYIKYSEKYNIKKYMCILFDTCITYLSTDIVKYLLYLALHNYNNSKYYIQMICKFSTIHTIYELLNKIKQCNTFNNIDKFYRLFIINNNIYYEFDIQYQLIYNNCYFCYSFNIS